VSLRPQEGVYFDPLPELQQLRYRPQSVGSRTLHCSSQVLPAIRGDCLELIAEFDPGDAMAFGLRTRRSDDGSRNVEIRYDEQGLIVDGKRGLFNEKDKDHGPFKLESRENTLRLHVFLDKAILEVYVNRRACYSRLLAEKPEEWREEDQGVEVFAEDGTVTLKSLECWQMKSIW
jgi:sucrose-6-phosphate hydrolase SacC (GH32 family)